MRRAAAAIMVCTSLAGCVTAGPDGVATYAIHKKVVSGEKTFIGNFWKLAPDCSSAGVPQIYVLTPPKHGKLVFVNEKRFPAAARGDYKKCRTVKVDMMVGYYTPNPGYVGEDDLKFRMSAQDGRIGDAAVKIDVLK
ncbi:hypothetical protein SAMN05880590_101917 [Rhizobium sp. RU35A]|nr:hypothetical protein SAMN05880590_101917 [Rhizobium sp. RU35A]